MVTELGKHIGVDSILKHIIRHTEDFLIKGDSPTEESLKNVGVRKKSKPMIIGSGWLSDGWLMP